MSRLLRGQKGMKVNVSNGSKRTIWCRVAGDKVLQVQTEVGGGVGVQGVGVNAHLAANFKHIAGATRGYSEIQSGNTLKFRLSTSSNSVYLTVISVSGHTICKNHEISKSSNYIINRRGGLLDAKKKKKWIDTNGRNHMLTYDDTNGGDSKEDGDRTDFNHEDHFTNTADCW